jgi:hypothetical protein
LVLFGAAQWCMVGLICDLVRLLGRSWSASGTR